MNAAADALMGIFGLKRVKPKTCKLCRQKFEPRTALQVVCSPVCAVGYASLQREKAGRSAAAKERREVKARKEAIKTRAEWAKDAQKAVNEWVRARDADLPCISCGRHHQGQWHAGHYLSRGAHPELAYEPLNLAKQCAPCNTHLSGNQALFRVGLIARIGIDAVEWLEGPHEPRKWSIDDLKAIRDEYRAKLKEMKGKP